MNTRFRTAKPLQIRTFVLITNQQQIEGVSKKLIPLKTGPYLIIEKATDTTYILQNQNKEKIAIHLIIQSHVIQKKNISKKNSTITYLIKTYQYSNNHKAKKHRSQTRNKKTGRKVTIQF